MIKTKLTENYAGINISGDYDDLNELYDSIHYFIQEEACSEREDIMRDHLYGFLYDVRHAYQGDREIELVENGLVDYKKEYHDIKKELTDNVYYSFNYPLPDLLLDIILIQHFISKNNRRGVLEFNPQVNFVNSFYAKVVSSLEEFLTPVKFKKLKTGLYDSVMVESMFYPQWFEVITCDYLNYSKEQRERHFMKTMDEIYHYDNYADYSKMKLEMDDYCKLHNCNLSDVEMGDFPREINW